jgi:hypothetical protein
MSTTPVVGTDADLRLPDEDKTKHSSEEAGNPINALAWPVRTDRTFSRPATRDDLGSTWRFRRPDEVSRWLTRAPTNLEKYGTGFEDAASLAKTLLVELDGKVIAELKVQIEDGAPSGQHPPDLIARKPASLRRSSEHAEPNWPQAPSCPVESPACIGSAHG